MAHSSAELKKSGFQGPNAATSLQAHEEDTHYRVLPHNLEAEQGILGALLIDNRTWERVGDMLKPEYFYAPAHQRIFKAIQTLVDRGQTATPVTLKGYFEKDADLDQVGGAAYLVDLAAGVISVINVEDYANTIYDLFLRRELITFGNDVVNESYDQNLEADAQDTIESAEARLFSLAESGSGQNEFVTLRDSIKVAIEMAESAYNNKGGVTGVQQALRMLMKSSAVFINQTC